MAPDLQSLRGPLLRFCLGYLQRDPDAEDAVQEVMARAVASAVIPEEPRLWLFRIARNHCLNVLRARTRRRDAVQMPSTFDVAALASGPLTRLLRQEDQLRAQQLLATLPEATQEILRLRYVDELPREEIAELVGLPVGVVKSRLHEALHQLRGGG